MTANPKPATLRSLAVGQPGLVAALDDAVLPGGTAALDPSVPDHVWQAALVGPAATFLARPGKDLRARMVRTGWALAGGAPGDPRPDAIARVLEILHAGSLIVDDIEDGSRERRGEPALHVLVGEPLAINTGSWMYFWALAELARLALPGALELATHALVRCHQGQALDLAARVDRLAMSEVAGVVAATTRLKTGVLCRLATELGALAAGAAPSTRTAIGEFGERAGCALQMLDDLGGLLAPARRAKGLEDLRGKRPTWPWAWLAEIATDCRAGVQDDTRFATLSRSGTAWTELVAQLRGNAQNDHCCEPIGRADHDETRELRDDSDEHLEALADLLAERIGAIGRAAIAAQIAAALAPLHAIAPAPLVEAIAGELQRMTTLYGCDGGQR